MKRLLIFILLSCTFIFIGCSQEPSEKVAAYQENNEIIGPESEELIGNVSSTIYESIDRDNTEAEEILIQPVEGLGKQVTPPEGRYTISAGFDSSGTPQSGRILVYDENEAFLIDELYDNGFGISGVTVDLNGSHTVHVDGIDQAMIVPAETQLSNELTAGIWEVGQDIEAGRYAVTPAEYGFGYLHLFEEGESPKVFEFLNISPDAPIELDLEMGQKLRISGIHFLQFEPISS